MDWLRHTWRRLFGPPYRPYPTAKRPSFTVSVVLQWGVGGLCFAPQIEGDVMDVDIEGAVSSVGWPMMLMYLSEDAIAALKAAIDERERLQVN